MERGRILLVHARLPFRCLTQGSSELNNQTSLIPEAVEKATTPTRHRRRTRSTLDVSFTNLVDAFGSNVSLGPFTEDEKVVVSREFEIKHDKRHLSALLPKYHPVKFVGLPNTTEDHQMETLQSDYDCIPVKLDDHEQFYNYSAEILDQLFQYRLFERRRLDLKLMQGWEDLVKANERFADVILENYREGDLVIITDRRLLLVPKLIKDIASGVIPVAFFLDVPFPTSEIMRCHPQIRQILEGMLGSDLIIFQSYSYIRHFISTCTRVLGLESGPKHVEFNGIPVQLRLIPIGVNPDQVIHDLSTTPVQRKIDSIRKVFHGKRLILGIDPAESAKGILHKLAAFESLLEQEPKWIGDVIFVEIMTSEYSSNRNDDEVSKVIEAVAHINNRFGFLGYNPAIMFSQEPTYEEYLALLTMADIFIDTSERASFSRPALDYVLCQEKRHGQVIMSEFVGNAVYMPSAFIVNPWDHRELASVIEDCLTIPVDDMIMRHEVLSNTVKRNNIDRWWKTIISELHSSHESFKNYLQTPALDPKEVIRQYMMSSKRLFLLDYDGTLVGIKRTPSEAMPSPELLRTLRILCSDPSNHVYIISGRDRVTLEGMLGSIGGLGLSAEHGCYIRPAGSLEWIDLIHESELTWKPSVLEIMQYYTERTPGSVIEKKSASITWHYRLSDATFGTRQANELKSYIENSIAASHPIEVIPGKKNIEVHPVSTNKGNIVRDLLTRHAGREFVLCIGDDRTDEDMFQVFLQSSGISSSFITCKVGNGTATGAQFALRTPNQVISLLARLANISAERLNPSTI